MIFVPGLSWLRCLVLQHNISHWLGDTSTKVSSAILHNSTDTSVASGFGIDFQCMLTTRSMFGIKAQSLAYRDFPPAQLSSLCDCRNTFNIML
jgi:hypothetical protein